MTAQVGFARNVNRLHKRQGLISLLFTSGKPTRDETEVFSPWFRLQTKTPIGADTRHPETAVAAPEIMASFFPRWTGSPDFGGDITWTRFRMLSKHERLKCEHPSKTAGRPLLSSWDFLCKLKTTHNFHQIPTRKINLCGSIKSPHPHARCNTLHRYEKETLNEITGAVGYTPQNTSTTARQNNVEIFQSSFHKCVN